MKKMFDLNTEKILTNWGVSEAVRELIANALDEQKITSSKQIEVKKYDGYWKIRDYGRGLKESSLTQNESQEKLSRRDLIGKFGFGLKDALATLNRNNIKIHIKTAQMLLELKFAPKANFSYIETLHAVISPATEKTFVGTEICLFDIKDADIDEAKSKFLVFNGEDILDSTKLGQIINKSDGPAKIYINGICVAYEDNFAFSYNIISPPKSVLKHLNRERNNVGRTAYSEIVKKIILSSESEDVAKTLFTQFSRFHEGASCDELGWADIQEHAVKIISSNKRAVFFTHEQTLNHLSAVDDAKRNGYEIIYIPSSLSERLSNVRDNNGNSIRTVNEFFREMDESFEFDYVTPNELTKREREIYGLIPDILKSIGGKPKDVKRIRISNTMKKDYLGNNNSTLGIWDEENGDIVLHRSTLKDSAQFFGTLAHEVIHARTGYDDVSREFENALTDLIGQLIKRQIR